MNDNPILSFRVDPTAYEHPEVKVVVVTCGIDKVFCAGANIQMLTTSSHGHKVNFCKFTNETRNGIEDATANSGQTYIAAVNGTAAHLPEVVSLACWPNWCWRPIGLSCWRDNVKVMTGPLHCFD